MAHQLLRPTASLSKSATTILLPTAFVTHRKSITLNMMSIRVLSPIVPAHRPITLEKACTTKIPPCNIFSRRLSTNSSWDAEYKDLKARRNKNIIMHPDGHGKHILPGDFVLKKNPRTGVERKVLLEHALGYFWAVKELSLTNNKPILCNNEVIPAAEAELFPSLKGLNSLRDDIVDIPEFFVRNNRSKDATAQCTLVAISCKDFGAKLLPTWTKPFDEILRTGKEADRFEIVRITINEGRIAKLLSPFIVSGTKKNVPESDHCNTLLYYGDAGEMRDVLRMHNIYTGYVFLVDGIGRVRWAGSGEGTEEEVDSMIRFARELTQATERNNVRQKQQQSTGPRVGKKLSR
mmetsp:Transcript_21405/g.44810  ORF Transcript_21405/g.44810 Transcript_21405/m.44810 type:complete len:349 (-) Transcript_21405:87-1133(-)